eukprot:jgi/Ulvmu1/5168/UM021_0185.1
MATNKRYNPALQKMRLQSASATAVDPALNSYVLMLLRANTISGIDAKERPTSKLSIIVGLMQKMSALGEKHQKVLQALLRRVCMHGYVPLNTLVPLFDALHNQESNIKATKVLHYLISLVLGPGSAGTPVPLLPAAGTAFTTLAVDEVPFDVYSKAWAIIGDETAIAGPVARCGLRALTSATRCALTTLPSGKQNDKKAAQLVQDLKAAVDIFLGAETREHKSKKKAEAEIQGLQRSQAAALLATRAALPRRELAALLAAVAQLFTFSSPLAVRHGLAVMCRVPSARVKPLLAPLSAPLRAAFEMYAPMGLMHEDGHDDPTSAHRGAAGVMALSDWLGRVYLARLLCKLIFAGVVSGPQKQFMWRVLVRLAFSPREKPHVRLEVWKALFGEVLPQALNIFPAGNPSHTALPLAPFSDSTEQQLAAFKAMAWRTSTSILLPQQAGEGGRRHKTAQDLASEAEGGDRLRLIVQQLLRMLESASSATVCGGARALRCIAEARAHAVHASGEEYSEDPRITDMLMNEVVPALRQCVVSMHASAVKLKMVEALVWLHLPSQPTITPTLLRSAVHISNPSQSPIAGYSPWPPSDISAVVQAVDRRILTAPELTAELLTAVSAMASGAPSSMLPTVLMRLWTRAMDLEVEVGVHNGSRDAALQAAVDLLAAPTPSMCSPGAAASPFEIAIGMKEWHAWSALKEMAITWLGDHANHCTDELVWYPPPPVERKAPAQHEKGTFGEQEMLGVMAMRNPRLMSVISQLQRAALTLSWQLRVAAVRALGSIAVKADEPFRFHCYSLLNALAGTNADDSADVLGLMTKVTPIIRLLDRMYAGQIVMKQYCDAYGLDWSKWHPEIFHSVQRRHEALVADVQQALTLSIPEGAFFPLGIKSQILLTGEAAVVDPEALAQVQEYAIAKAEARFAEKQRQKELELVGEAIDEEFEEEADEAERTDSQSMQLETITIEDDGQSGFVGVSSGDGGGGGFMQPDFDPFDPKAWAEQDPSLFAGVDADPAPQDSTGTPTVEEIAISGTLDASGSLQRVQSQPSPRPVRQVVQPASPSPLSGQPMTTAATPQAAAARAAATPGADSDSDDSEQLDARAALYTLGMPASQDGLPTSAVQTSLAGRAHPFGAAADPLAGSAPGPPAAQASTAAAGADDEETVPLGVVVYQFEAVEEGELTVQEGEEVYVLGYIEGGWAQVQLLATGEVGNVPEWAVQEVDAQLAAAGASASMSRAISDADSALLRATSTPRPAPQPGAAVSARMSLDGPRHRRMASSATVFSDVGTPARASVREVEDNPFTGGGNGGGDDILGLFDAGDGGDVAADTADLPGVDTADPFGLDGLFVTEHGASASAGIGGAVPVDVLTGEGDSAAHFETSAPALDPGLVAASGPGAASAGPAAAASASVDNPFQTAGAGNAAEPAAVPASSDNPFGQN